MPPLLPILLTVAALVIPSLAEDKKPGPQKSVACRGLDEKHCQEAQAYLRALEAQETPDRLRQLQQQLQSLEEELRKRYPSQVLPIPAEHPQRFPQNKS